MRSIVAVMAPCDPPRWNNTGTVDPISIYNNQVGNMADEQERMTTDNLWLAVSLDSLYLLQTGENIVLMSSVEMTEQRKSSCSTFNCAT